MLPFLLKVKMLLAVTEREGWGGTMEDSAAELINTNNNYYHWLSDPGRKSTSEPFVVPFHLSTAVA